jgi:hypothetical protein
MEEDPAMLMDAFGESKLTIGPEECSEFPRLDEMLGSDIGLDGRVWLK